MLRLRLGMLKRRGAPRGGPSPIFEPLVTLPERMLDSEIVQRPLEPADFREH